LDRGGDGTVPDATRLIVVTGPPGAGKSTVAAALATRFDPSVLVAGDAFYGFLASGAVAPWLPESAAQNEVVTQASAAAAGRFARGGYATIFDGIIGPWFLPTFVTATDLECLHYVVLLPSLERCLHGVATRVGHGFDDVAATEKMHGEFARADVDARHVLTDPPDGVDAVAELIAAGIRRGAFRHEVSR
jgi:hypothetical protein